MHEIATLTAYADRKVKAEIEQFTAVRHDLVEELALAPDGVNLLSENCSNLVRAAAR